MSSTTSPSLLMRVRDPTDEDAWLQFLDIYTPVVRTYCFQRRIQEADVEDIVQDVMSRIARAIRAFEYDPVKGRFRGWLGTIAANKIKSFFAKETRRAGDERECHTEEIYADPDSDWIAIFSERVFSIACNQVRNQFSETTWQSFEATWIRKEPASRVARELGVPIHSVYVNKSRVLKKLEAEVKLLVDDVPIPGPTGIS